jgi:peptidoglycan/LPS O-acetylase OafA/YrhL
VLQGGAVSSAAIAFMMAAAMAGAGPIGRVLRRLLSGASWKPLSDFSYSAYLYHEQVSTEPGTAPCSPLGHNTD